MKIICDTGPIIALAKIDKIYLLKGIAEEVLIPPMVFKELLGKVGDESNQIDRALSDIIRIKESGALDPAAEKALAGLGEGEKQAIGLAFNLKKDILLLLDDRAGRECAEKLNIPTTGLIGLLLILKQKGLVEDIVPFIDELRNKGYWLSDEVINVARRLAGE